MNHTFKTPLLSMLYFGISLTPQSSLPYNHKEKLILVATIELDKVFFDQIKITLLLGTIKTELGNAKWATVLRAKKA